MDSFPVSALIVQSHPEASEVPLAYAFRELTFTFRLEEIGRG